jgi:iron(III) transport system substrate-binding protein
LDSSPSRYVPWIALALVVAGFIALWRFYSPGSAPVVVVYVSHDQVFSEPILKDFEKNTGIKVLAVYDTEETKSAGAMNRLIAEKNNPQADVYWANEPVRAEVLRQQHISAPYVSPNAAGIPDTFRNPEGYWIARDAGGQCRGALIHVRVAGQGEAQCIASPSAHTPLLCSPLASA